MSSDFRDRVLLPVGVPVGAVVGIGILVVSFSRILLAVEREVAVAIAFAAALDILLIATLIAGRKPETPPLHIPLLALSAAAIVGGGFFAMRVEAARPPEHGPQEKAPVVKISADNTVFDRKELALPPGGVISFRNDDDGVQHNVAIFADQAAVASGAEPLFKGKIITGPATVDYKPRKLAPGAYYFHCDVHPQMNGTVTVGEAGGARIKADLTAFDVAELKVGAGKPSVISFNNADKGVPHNVAVYRDEATAAGGGEALFKGAIITGPARKEYELKPLAAGTYYFQCDVHPTMKGRLVAA